MLEVYLNTFKNPMRRAKVKIILETVQGFSGLFMQRYKFAELQILTGDYLPDDEKKRFYHDKSGSFYEYKDITITLINYYKWLKIVDDLIYKCKSEICDLKKEYNRQFKNFSELHGVIDANCIGNMDHYLDILGIEGLNRIQEKLDNWLQNNQVINKFNFYC